MLVGLGERALTAEELVDDNTEAVDVGAVVYGEPLVLLRGGVSCCIWAGFVGSGEGGVLAILKLYDAEVGKKDAPIGVPEQVMGFNVTVDELMPMGGIKGRGHLLENGSDANGW